MSDKARIDDVEGVRETEYALLVDFDGDQVWIPKSQIDDDSEVWRAGQSGQLVIPLWLAEKKGLA